MSQHDDTQPAPQTVAGQPPTPPAPPPDRPAPQGQPAYMTLAAAARLLGVSYRTLLRAVLSGRLPAVDVGNGSRHVWRISQQALESYLHRPARGA